MKHQKQAYNRNLHDFTGVTGARGTCLNRGTRLQQLTLKSSTLLHKRTQNILTWNLTWMLLDNKPPHGQRSDNDDGEDNQENGNGHNWKKKQCLSKELRF